MIRVFRLFSIFVLSITFVWLLGFLTRCFTSEFMAGLFTLLFVGLPLSIIIYFGMKLIRRSLSDSDSSNSRTVLLNSCKICLVIILGFVSGLIFENIAYRKWRSHRIISSYEASAIGNLIIIGNSELDYCNNSVPQTYASMEEMCKEFGKPQMELRYFNMNLCSGEVAGYKFRLQLGDKADEHGGIWSWSATAWPVIYGKTGKRTFYIDENRVIRGSDIGGIPGQIELPIIESIR